MIKPVVSWWPPLVAALLLPLLASVQFSRLASASRQGNESNSPAAYLLNSLAKFELRPQTPLARLIYDDYYIRNLLDERYPYLKLANGSYLGIRDYFHFERVFWPTDDYLARHNIEQTLYNELQALETTASQASLDTWLYSDQDQLERSGGPLADADKCQRAMGSLLAELQAAEARPNKLFEPGRRNMELLRWIDSWARPVSETYLGDTFWVGSYRGCRAIELDLRSANESVDGQRPMKTGFNYCWAKIAPRDWPGPSDPMRPRMSVKTGVCLPDSCDTVQARKMLPTILKMMQFNFSPMHKQRFVQILDVYCLPNERQLDQSPPETGRSLSTGARWFLGLFGLWTGAVLAASVWACRAGGQPQQAAAGGEQTACWRSLTLNESYRLLTSEDAPPQHSRLDLRPTGLVKLLAALMVVLGHTFLQNYYSFHATQVLIRENYKLQYFILSPVWKSVEMFYVVSGVLTAYSILKKFAPNNKMHLIITPKVYFFLNLVRYLRVAPLFMFAWAFVKTTYTDLGEGPFWDYGTNQYTFMGRCKRISWWRSLIWPIILDFKGYTGDPYQHECMSISWYVVTDLKMFIVVPLYLYLAHRFPRLRWPLLLFSLALSTLWRLAHLNLQQLIHWRQMFTYGEMHAVHIIISKLDSAYYSPVDRFQAMAFGLTGGLYLYEFRWGRLKRWPWWMRGKAIAALLVWWLFDLCQRPWQEHYFRQTGYIPAEEQIRALFILRPRMDALITTILVLRLCTDWSRAVMRHSSFLYKLSKLSFGVYVFHMLPILYNVMGHERAKPDTIVLQFMQQAVFAIAVSFLIALPLYLLVEAPLTMMVDHFLLGQHKADRLASSATVKRHNATTGQPQPAKAADKSGAGKGATRD